MTAELVGWAWHGGGVLDAFRKAVDAHFGAALQERTVGGAAFAAGLRDVARTIQWGRIILGQQHGAAAAAVVAEEDAAISSTGSDATAAAHAAARQHAADLAALPQVLQDFTPLADAAVVRAITSDPAFAEAEAAVRRDPADGAAAAALTAKADALAVAVRSAMVEQLEREGESVVQCANRLQGVANAGNRHFKGMYAATQRLIATSERAGLEALGAALRQLPFAGAGAVQRARTPTPLLQDAARAKPLCVELFVVSWLVGVFECYTDGQARCCLCVRAFLVSVSLPAWPTAVRTYTGWLLC